MALGSVALGALMSFGASCGDTCVGGVVVDGHCEGRCEPDLCLENNVCVGNRCMLECVSHTECYQTYRGDPKQQGCLPQAADSETDLYGGDTVFVCTDVVKANGILKACPFGDECDDPDVDDDAVCPDGSGCTAGVGSDRCSAAECRPLACHARGEGDAEAYCTNLDCATDDDCLPGMACGIVSDPSNICGTDKGTDTPCVDPSDFTTDGKTYVEGPVSLLRHACLKRGPCSPCSNTTDCSLTDGLACVDVGGGVFACAASCVAPEDCPSDFVCDAGSCKPRSGTCTPPATANFCFNCVDDLQCGDASSTTACVDTSNGEKGCFDLSFPDACTTDDECPTSPSGAHGTCLDEGEGLSPADMSYHRCFLPFDAASGQFACWPQ
ncbi:MAG: hypothetical protein U0271_12775 [Polyangiaceae bacterium]